MKKLSTMGVALLAIVLASSCGSSKNALQTSALEGEWNIITVNGKEATADKDVFIGLNLKENRVYGCAGCNRIMGAMWIKTKPGTCLSGRWLPHGCFAATWLPNVPCWKLWKT